jgi:hypothetical protein|tara:strand:- start:315 stop:488 length:174 start_codon:yes stop_codon:yes gene_type:complete
MKDCQIQKIDNTHLFFPFMGEIQSLPIEYPEQAGCQKYDINFLLLIASEYGKNDVNN